VLLYLHKQLFKAIGTGGRAQCIVQEAIGCRHCKSSSLLRKLSRSKQLKHPRSEPGRAGQRGVTHKFCSEKSIENTLQIQNKKGYKLKESNDKLMTKLEGMLRDSWQENNSKIPFLRNLHLLIEDGKLSTFDTSFLSHWSSKKLNGRNSRADEQARAMAVLYCNRLGQKTYSELAPILGLPGLRQAQRIKSKLVCNTHYMPGINEWAIEKAGKHEKVPLQNGMDGLRVVRAIELYVDKYLVGEQFPIDVRQFPAEPPNYTTPDELFSYVNKVRLNKSYSAEAYSLNLTDTTGLLSDIIIGIIPEATKGNTGGHIFSLMMEVEKRAARYNLPLIGHCTDSASNVLKALVRNASPDTYNSLQPDVKFVGLNLDDFVYFAPVLHTGYPCISYPFWDHSSRTSVRNLMNLKIQIVAEVLANVKDGYSKYTLATIQNLKTLKCNNPNSKVRYADITPHVKQNCNATVRVISKRIIDELEKHVPTAHGTILYLQASLWIHEPYRNQSFGPPTSVVQSLWAGICTWRRWRKYIKLVDGVTLTNNWISRSHYLTLELMAHAGILHQLALFLSFPELNLDGYSLRNTGNRTIEAVHSILRGGAANLPNNFSQLVISRILSRMNQVKQIKESEHTLQKIPGNTIKSTKKKVITYAARSNEGAVHSQVYTKPKTYSQFVAD